MISRFSLLAQADVAETRAWYRTRDPGLDARFLECLEVALDSIERYLDGHPPVYRDVRRVLLRPFPFGIFYRVRAEAVIVLAVLHTSRDPGIVRRRIR